MLDPKSLWDISYGLYIITAKDEDQINGQIANAVFQVSATPQTVAISINRENYTHELIQKGKKFNLMVLSEQVDMTLVQTFGYQSGHSIDKFQNISYSKGLNGLPIVTSGVTTFIECDLINQIDVETHTIFIGNVTAGEIIGEGTPMTYAYYHRVKGGKAPKNAPTYIDESALKESDTTKTCNICSYEYDPQEHDGVLFEDLPNDWECPICSAGKGAFK